MWLTQQPNIIKINILASCLLGCLIIPFNPQQTVHFCTAETARKLQLVTTVPLYQCCPRLCSVNGVMIFQTRLNYFLVFWLLHRLFGVRLFPLCFKKLTSVRPPWRLTNRPNTSCQFVRCVIFVGVKGGNKLTLQLILLQWEYPHNIGNLYNGKFTFSFKRSHDETPKGKSKECCQYTQPRGGNTWFSMFDLLF